MALKDFKILFFAFFLSGAGISFYALLEAFYLQEWGAFTTALSIGLLFLVLSLHIGLDLVKGPEKSGPETTSKPHSFPTYTLYKKKEAN